MLVFITIACCALEPRVDLQALMKRLASPDEKTRIDAARFAVKHADNSAIPDAIGQTMLSHSDIQVRTEAITFFYSRGKFSQEIVDWLADAHLRETDDEIADAILDLLGKKGRQMSVLAMIKRLETCKVKTKRPPITSFIREMAERGYGLGDHAEYLSSRLDHDEDFESHQIAKAILSCEKSPPKHKKRAVEYLMKVYDKAEMFHRLRLCQYVINFDNAKPRVMRDIVPILEKEPIRSTDFLRAMRSGSFATDKKEIAAALEIRLKKELAAEAPEPGYDLVALVCYILNPNSKVARGILDIHWDDQIRMFDLPVDERYIELFLEVLPDFQAHSKFPRAQIERLASGPYVSPRIQTRAKELLKKLKK